MTELEERVEDVLLGMKVLPEDIRIQVLARLGRIEGAVAEGLMEAGVILVPFRDLSGSNVVLGLLVDGRDAFLDISTAEDALALSYGYSFRTTLGGVVINVDRDHRLDEVDHGRLAYGQMLTTQALERIDEARALMRTHPVFRDLP